MSNMIVHPVLARQIASAITSRSVATSMIDVITYTEEQP